MILIILRLLSLVCSAFWLHSNPALENLALRNQLAIMKRTRPRPRLRRSDRIFWLILSRTWSHWRKTLVIVKPATGVRWHRKRFASYWNRLSRRSRPGRPGKDPEIRELDSEDREWQRPVGRAAGTWRAPETRNQRLGEDCISVDAEAKKTAFADLESIPGQPYQRTCLD